MATKATVTLINNSAMTFTGTWSNVSNAAGINGNYYQTSTANDFCTVTIPSGTRAIYLIGTEFQNSVSTSGSILYSLDGVQQGSNIYRNIDSMTPTQQYYRFFTPLTRNLDPSTSHTVVITNAVTATIAIDSIACISGAKGTPTIGNYVAMGDSWTVGGGATTVNVNYVNKLVSILRTTQSREFTLFNKGINGDALYGQDTTKVGAVYNFYANVLPNTPEFLTLQYGRNDSTLAVGQILKNFLFLLCFIEDTLDVTQTNIALGTPSFGAAGMEMPTTPLGSRTYSQSIDNYEVLLAGFLQMTRLFPWLKVAHTYEAMDSRAALMYPNNNLDVGNHPNTMGHAVLAWEFARALLGYA